MVSRGRALLVAASLAAFIMIATAMALAASAPGVEWGKKYDMKGNDQGTCVQLTSDGGYILAGTADNFVYGSRTTGSPKACLVKVDKDGNMVWNKTYGFGRYSLGNSVRQTSDGGYILAGSVRYDDQFKVLLVKTDGQGNQVWNNTYGDTRYGDMDGGGYSVRQAGDGGYVVAGQYPIAGHYGLYIIKTDANGNKIWNATISMSADITGPSLDLAGDGGYVVASTIYTYGTPSDYDIFLVKYDGESNMQWEKLAGGDGFQYCGRGDSVRQVGDGGYAVSGENGGAYLVKADGAGNVLWSRQYGNSTRANSVVQADDGGYVLACCDTGGDLQAIKTDPYGNEEWRQAAGSGQCEAMSIQKAGDGGYILFGSSGGDLYLVKLKAPAREPVILPTDDSGRSTGVDLSQVNNSSKDPGPAGKKSNSLFGHSLFQPFGLFGGNAGSPAAKANSMFGFPSMPSFGNKKTISGLSTDFPKVTAAFGNNKWPFR